MAWFAACLQGRVFLRFWSQSFTAIKQVLTWTAHRYLKANQLIWQVVAKQLYWLRSSTGNQVLLKQKKTKKFSEHKMNCYFMSFKIRHKYFTGSTSKFSVIQPSENNSTKNKFSRLLIKTYFLLNLFLCLVFVQKKRPRARVTWVVPVVTTNTKNKKKFNKK